MRTFIGQGLPCDTTDLLNYPKGRVKDDSAPGVHDGTPLTELAGLSDIYQGVIEQMRIAGVVPDETPEKKAASQIVEAFGWFAPVCVLRVGGTMGNITPRVLGGKYQPGYTATFVYHELSGDAALFKLSILKGGLASATEKYCVQVTPAKGANALVGSTNTAAAVCSARHDVADASFYFINDTQDNVSVAAGNVSDASENDLKLMPMIITVHRVE